MPCPAEEVSNDLLAAAIKGTARTVVFLDEISWMGHYDSSFAALLKDAWDLRFSKRQNLVLVQTAKSVCLVEIKRKKRIDESVEAEVCEKLNRLKLARNISRRTALVYEGALSQSVQDNGFFDFIVPVSELLH